ncbi:MAG TPA: APC family permease [Methylomirabilota bacterium]|nr:APC family permease [Methylomirabilota bacterium]
MEMSILKRLIVGAPMPLAQARHERLSKTVALAVFSSDAMSSVAYATEEILLILVLAGTAAAHLTVPIALAIAGLLVVVSVSYQQTIHAYPSGGGSYIVARANLGPTAGLVAAAALLIDYVLTVSVSVAAGVAALTSAVPWLLTHRVLLGVVFTAAIAYANLRGVRESGRVFAVPTYLFIVTFSVLVGTGLFRWLTGTLPAAAAASETVAATQTLTWFLVLRAFASGCTALTGVEAISNGVPAFKHPEARNAAITMGWMAAVLGTLFIGVSVLASALGITPLADETVVSQVARRLFGGGLPYYLVQGSTTLILVLAANTSFADFPRLNSLLARDRYAPRQFRTLGDRLVFSNGILILAGLAAALIVVFGGDTHALIPLYAVGVFISFTLSQAGMVRHWLTDGGAGWRWRLGVNGVGALVTGAVTVVIAVTKFTHGAWIVVLLIPLLVVGFRAIYRHYDTVAHELSLEHLVEEPPVNNTVLVLVGDLHMGVVKALRYAQSLSPSPKAVYVELDPSVTARLEERWSKGGCGVPLVVLASPYRSMLRPLLDYIGRIRERDANSVVTIVIPEFVPRRWWQHLLHNQTALLVKGALLFRRGVVVVDVPFHLHS